MDFLVSRTKAFLSIPILFLSVLTTIPLQSNAEIEYPERVTLFFGNGIFTDEWGATNNLIALRFALAPEIQETDLENNLSYRKAYNRSEGPFGLFDLVEAASQYLEINVSRAFRYFSGADPAPEALSLFLIQYGINELNRISLLDFYPNVQEHYEEYKKSLEECTRIVLVAHSQGNFYGNIAYSGIEEHLPSLLGGFKIVSLANPASFVASNGPHTTLKKDRLITNIPNSMPWNFENYGPDETPLPFWGLGHLFEENYLAQDRLARRKIVDDIVRSIRDVQGFDNIDYCGWPAVYGDGIGVFFQPYDVDPEDPSLTSAIWDKVWQAAISGELTVQFSRTNEDNWITLNNNGVYGYRVEFTHDVYVDYLNTTVEIPPWIYITNTSDFRRPARTIEVQVHDQSHVDNFALPASTGIYQYRFIIDNQVIDQFRIRQNPNQFDEFTIIETSQPITAPLHPGSLPIIPLL